MLPQGFQNRSSDGWDLGISFDIWISNPPTCSTHYLHGEGSEDALLRIPFPDKIVGSSHHRRTRTSRPQSPGVAFASNPEISGHRFPDHMDCLVPDHAYG